MELSERFIKQLEAEGFAHIFEDEDDPGVVYPPHSHVGKVSLCITDGSVVFDIGGEKHEYTAGDRVDVPPGIEHSAVVGPERLRYIVAEEIRGDA